MIRAALAALGLCLGAAPGVQEEPTFTCQLVLSADLAGVDRWYASNVPDFQLAGTESVVRGQHFLLYVFLQGCARDEGGALDVTLDLSILRPDGSVYHEAEGARALDGEKPGEFLLAQDLTGVFFEDEDALGTYRVQVVAHDRVGRVEARAEQSIELVPYAEGAPFADGDEVWAWLWRYYHAPEPCRAAPALRALAQGGQEVGLAHGAMAELFQDNGWLFPILFADLEDEAPATRELLLWMLARTSHEPAPFVSDLEATERAAWERFAAAPNPREDPLTGREDLNELLGRYALGRAHAPLLKLVRALARDGGGMVADVSLYEPTNDVDVPLAHVISKVVARALASFASDPATRGYLEVMAADESLPEEVRARLAELLAPQGAGAEVEPEPDD